tara:strand:- start:7363 stop:7632 length:270 start_codon:yes stop_codon:yes gene_type:complete
MKILISVDSKKHFNAAHPSDRNNVIKLLQTIEDGAYYYEIMVDYQITLPSDLSTMCCQDWDEFIQKFIQSGALEYVEIPDLIPKACACE